MIRVVIVMVTLTYEERAADESDGERIWSLAMRRTYHMVRYVLYSYERMESYVRLHALHSSSSLFTTVVPTIPGDPIRTIQVLTVYRIVAGNWT
jgi:hypothetical protein